MAVAVEKKRATIEAIEKLSEENDTLPKLLRAQTRKYGDSKVCMCKKDLGIWVPYAWTQVYEHVKWVHLGLIALGLEPGDRVAIVGDNDPQWFWAEWAVQTGGGVVIGMYVDFHYAEVKYVVGWGEAKFAFAKDQEQVDKIIEVKDALPQLQKVIYWESKGLWFYDDPSLMSFEELEELGRKYEQEHPTLFEENIDKTKGDDLACFVLSSGTTRVTTDGVARPQMGMQTHNSLISLVKAILAFDPWYESDVWLSYLSPAWAEQYFGLTGCLLSGTQINFPEEPETVTNDTREVGPQVLLYTSRLWENVASTILSKMSETGGLKKLSYNLMLPVGYKVAEYRFAKKEPPIFWKVLYWIADMTALRPLRDKIGLLGIRTAYTAGTLLGPDTFRFFQAIGVNIKQAYGSTEIGLVTIHPDDDVDPETVGKVIDMDWMRISPEGEIIFKGPVMAQGYWRDPETWNKQIDSEGWYHTGDCGHLNEQGHLIFYDRMKDVAKLPSGRTFAPQYIESRLKFSSYLKDCMVMGGEGKGFVSAMINVDFENVSDWAEEHHIMYTTFVDLSQKPEVYGLILKDIQRVNRYLPEEARIKRFFNLHKELDPDEAELTRSRKIRRKFMEERFAGVIEAIYKGEDKYEIEAAVKYRDGRTGVIKTHIMIKDVPEA